MILIILDGWGIGRNDESNPIYTVNPPVFKFLQDNYPTTSLQASGINVGLPWGEVGNSEVGHLTLGAGKILYQYFPKITMAIQDGSFFENKSFKDAFAHVKENNSTIHFAGLLSHGNVHASLEHIDALLKMAEKEGVTNVQLHLFADGKDVPPRSIESFLKKIPRDKIATLIGRYYAMDRNGSWRLTQVAYELMTGNLGTLVEDPIPTIKSTFDKGLTEEYLPALKLRQDAGIKDNDSLIFFNYREDSIRQLAESFILPDFDGFPVKKIQNLYIATMTHYEDSLDIPVAFPPDTVSDTLGKVLSDTGRNQLRLAETYKYAHVTYFFNGLREPPYKGEYRALIPSISTPNPDTHPEMMASGITDRLIEAIQDNSFDFILVNYANGDTMGHTSNYQAAEAAVKTINDQLDRVLKFSEKTKPIIIITADHGNIEEMINPITALPESQHDPSPVPLYLIAPEYKGRKFTNQDNIALETLGSLADVAPTILELMKIPQPPEMTGRSLMDSLI